MLYPLSYGRVGSCLYTSRQCPRQPIPWIFRLSPLFAFNLYIQDSPALGRWSLCVSPPLGNSHHSVCWVRMAKVRRLFSPFLKGTGPMIRTEQLTPDTMMFHVRGRFNPSIAKELSLSVLHSYHLGYKTFLCNLSLAILLDDAATRQLLLIGEGLRNKGKTWRVIRPPCSLGDQLILRTTLQHLPHESWN